MIPIFDSLSHPTVSGGWYGRSLDAGFEKLVSDLKANGYRGAMAVGLPGTEEYTHETFMEKCQQYPELVPIAGFDINHPDYMGEIQKIKSLGYAGIKIHPRISNLDYEDNIVSQVMHACGENGLVVLYCTYAHCSMNKYPVNDPLYYLVRFLKSAGKTKVILMHGGDVQVLKYAELVRFNENLLLDLSMTFMKYQGSSVDDDIRFLLSSFDRRICIGTDHPEYTHKHLRQRFETLCAETGIDHDKMLNVAHRNIERFLGLS